MFNPNLFPLEILHWLVVGSAFLLAVLFGVVAQRTHFCTMGAVADIVHMGDWNRMRMWGLAMAVAIFGVAGLSAAQIIDPQKSMYVSAQLRWLSHLVGGLLFGVGMVLASGCGAKTLVRIGGGNLKSLVVFLVMGVSAYATLRGLSGWLRVAFLDPVALTLPVGQTIPQLLLYFLGGQPGATFSFVQLHLLVATVCASALAWLILRCPAFRRADYMLGGLMIGAIVVAVWWVSGYLGYVTEDPNTLQERFLATNSGRMESLSFVAPYAYTLEWIMFWTDQSKRLTVGIASVFGVITGAALMAFWQRTFRWEVFRDARDMGQHLLGAILMGCGGITALGCTIGQGLAGISTLALGAFLSIAAMIAGALLALRYQMWALERDI